MLFLALTESDMPKAAQGDVLAMSPQSAFELKIDALCAQGTFRQLTDEEEVAYIQTQV